MSGLDSSAFWSLADVFMLVVIYVLVIASSELHSRPGIGQNSDASTRTKPWKSGGDNGGQGEYGNTASRHMLRSSEAALDVHSAWTELRALQNSDRRSARFRKKSGLVGSTAYYAKKGFVLLFMKSQEDYLNPGIGTRKLSKPLAKVVKLLENAARSNNPDAIYLLAEMNFHGNFTHPRNYKEAFKRYHELAALTGNSSAQHMLGFMYATGIGDAVERNQAMALTYYTFAANAGNTKSEMTMAYRHHAGIGTPKDCNRAAVYYKRVADKAIQYARSGPPGGLPMIRDAYRLADEEGGVYGEGASFSSSGANSNHFNPSSDQNAALDDVMEYLDLMSRKGDPKATFSLGRLHYEGSRTMRRDYAAAKKYFDIVAYRYWTKNLKVRPEHEPEIDKIASKAAAYIGRLYLRGEGVQQNFEMALKWFRLGLSNGDPFCQYEIGLMYLLGLGVPKNVLKAADFFKEAAKQNRPAAQVQLGKLFLDQGDLNTAILYFESGARHGHIEAVYHLAEINNNGVGQERSCGHATAYYKIVAEKAEALHSAFEEANAAYEDGDKETALVGYMMAAEQGYEQAQANVAYILDEQKSIVSLDSLIPWKSSRPLVLRNPLLALVYWTRSARQSNIDSMVKMGDYYFKGSGVPIDLENAATCYQSAAEMPQSAQAAWNLGWMYENGIGVEQDFHLAWRFYMQAMEANSESYLPVKLSLTKLRIRNWWNKVSGGGVNPIMPEPGE